MTKPAPTYLDLWFEVQKLAKRGLGYEDCIVKLNMPRDAETRDWVRRIVLGKGWEK